MEKRTYGSRIYAGRISQSANTSCRKLHEKRNFVDEIGMREICMQVSALPRLDLFDRRGNVNKVESCFLSTVSSGQSFHPATMASKDSAVDVISKSVKT